MQRRFRPIVFVHGNGDHTALWMTTLWRMESNGILRDRLFAIDFTDPQTRADDAVPEQNRSSTQDQRRLRRCGFPPPRWDAR
jgi:hypothetical protein